MLSKEIADALEKADPDHKDIYQENASAYSEKLKDLDAKYQEVVDGASQKTLLFGDRFPFRYLVDDYGLSYFLHLSDEDYLEQETEIIVQGTFETYKEPNDETLYCRITDADMQIKK